MKILAFQNEELSRNQSVLALIEFFQNKGHEVIPYNEDAFETLDNDPALSRIVDTAIEVSREQPDMVFVFNSTGLIPWLYESMRIPYIDYLLPGQEEPFKDLENPDMRMYGESNYCYIFCPDRESARTVQEMGYVHTLIGDAPLEDPELLGKIETAAGIIIQELKDKAGPQQYDRSQQSSAGLFRLGCQLIFDAKWLLAAQTLAGALEQNDDNQEAFYYLVAILEKLGRGKEAKSKLTEQLEGLSEEEHNEALQMRSDAYCAVGLGLEAEGLFEEAVDAYQKAIRLTDSCFLAYNNLGALLLRAENLELAGEYLRAALQIQDTYSPTHFNLALLYENLGQYDEAVEAAETFLDLTPDSQPELLKCGRELIRRLEERQKG